jgi:cbb3-type cytochrome oxidase subunit 3
MEHIMDRPLLMALVLAFLLILLALMFFGWRRRQRSQAGIPRPLTLPDDLDAATLSVSGFYVATTVADEPLNRIAVAGLGYRARASVAVHARGLALAIPGQAPIFVPATDIRSVQKATWTIDRAVEQGGLILVRWVLGTEGADQVEVDSYLRLGDRSDNFFDSVQELHTTTQAGGRAQ